MYLYRYESILGSQLVGQRALRAMVNGCWEANAQNRTDELPEEFVRRQTYRVLRPFTNPDWMHRWPRRGHRTVLVGFLTHARGPGDREL